MINTEMNEELMIDPLMTMCNISKVWSISQNNGLLDTYTYCTYVYTCRYCS